MCKQNQLDRIGVDSKLDDISGSKEIIFSKQLGLISFIFLQGVTSILANYWLMIPSNVIKTVFQKLLSDLLYDASSAEVRTQVLKASTTLSVCLFPISIKKGDFLSAPQSACGSKSCCQA